MPVFTARPKSPSIPLDFSALENYSSLQGIIKCLSKMNAEAEEDHLEASNQAKFGIHSCAGDWKAALPAASRDAKSVFAYRTLRYK